MDFLHPVEQTARLNRVPLRERGAILIVSLLLLLVLTILGVTVMQITRVEERMAGNLQDANVAFQGSEAALRTAEETLRIATLRPATCASTPCANVVQTGGVPELRDQTAAWWDGNGRLYADSLGTSRQTRFIIEDAGFIPDSLTVGHGIPEGRNFYRVDSHSTGATDSARAVVESTYTRRF